MIAILVKIGQWLAATLSGSLILLVRCYQVAISPMLPSMCRFTPSCSHYFIQAVKKFGPLKGSWKGVCRICRCHPFSRGGYDPP